MRGSERLVAPLSFLFFPGIVKIILPSMNVAFFKRLLIQNQGNGAPIDGKCHRLHVSSSRLAVKLLYEYKRKPLEACRSQTFIDVKSFSTLSSVPDVV